MTEPESLTRAQQLADTVKDTPRYVLVTMTVLMISMTGIGALWHVATLLIAQCAQ